MADLTITAASVEIVLGSSTVEGTAGETITAGQPVYKDASDSDKVKAADANASKESADCVGIALHGATDGQPLVYVSSGDVDLGATLTIGTIYVVSATSGGIAPEGDLTSGQYTTILGVATAANNLKMNLKASGVTKGGS